MLDALKVSRERAGIPDSLLLHTLAVLPFLADASRQGSAQSLFSDPAILVQLGCALVELATGVSARYRQPYGKTGESIPLHIDRLIQSLSRQPGDPSGSKSQTNALGAIHADLQYEMRKDIVQRNVAELTGRVHIQRRVVRLVGEIGIDTPKSEAGNRYIVLVSAARRVLKAWGAQQDSERNALEKHWHEDDWIFSSPSHRWAGRFLEPRWINRRMDQLIEKAGFPRVTVHELRHTFITAMLQSGVPVEEVSRSVGHSTIWITRHYGHAVPRSVDPVTAKGEELFGASDANTPP